MSSVEVKEQINRICRLARSFKELKAFCGKATAKAMEINNAMKNLRHTSDQTSVVLLDYDEVDLLKKENEEMKLLLSDYHRGVELLMEAYRKRIVSEVKDNSLERIDEVFDPKLLETIVLQGNRISEMRDIMKKTNAIDDNAENLLKEHIAYLRKENAVLRELYQYSTRFGSADNLTSGPSSNAVDKFCQTEELEKIDSEASSDDDDVITVISLKFDESDEEDDESKEILKCPGQGGVNGNSNITLIREREM